MKKNRWISLLLSVCSLGCIGLATGALSATAETSTLEKNKTLTVQSGYKSGMFAPLSPIREKQGATVEFDLYKSNLKEVNYSKTYDVMAFSGTSGGLACVSFVFGKVEEYPHEDAPQCPAWHMSDLTEINFGGFQYFANGQIKEWSHQGNSRLISSYVGTPASFMEEGYSYRVGIRYDAFEYDGEEYGGTGATWYYAERKEIFDEEAEYEMVFAFQKQLFDGASFTNGTMAGMEVQGLCKKANVVGENTSADGNGHSVNMEIDNLKIYDGVSYETATKKYSESFENVKSEQVETPDMSVNAPKINQFNGKNYLEFPSGIRNISANYGEAMGISEETTCRLGVMNRDLFTVTFKDQSTQETVATQKVYTGLDFSATKVYAGTKVYKFDYTNVDFDQVAGDVTVYGTPVSYFTLNLISGVSNVNDMMQRVSVEGKFKITEDLFVRENYDLIGFTRTEGGSEAEYTVGDTVDMRCQDMTLYAIWRMKSYSTVYMSEAKKMNTVTTRPGITPFYQGATPEKAGYAFAGWSATVAPSQNQILTANFVEIADVNAENKALAVKGNLGFTREGYDAYISVEVGFDLIELPEGAKVFVLGADITEFLTAGYRFKAAVNAAGSITVSKAYIDSDKYTEMGRKQTLLNTNSYMEIEFSGDIVFDTLTMTYDSNNAYVESFEGIEAISEGIYNNYYTVEGAGEIVPLAKDKAVTFIDETTGREVSKTYTYAGGNVMLVDELAGVSHEIVWDKTQDDLLDVQADITVKTNLTWNECNVSFVVDGVFDFMPVEETIAPSKGIYGQEITLPSMIVGNYAIIGWTDVENVAYAKYAGDYVLTKKNLTLYAVWGGKPLTVEFYAEDGTTLLEAQTVEYKATVLFGGEIPEKAGYKFVGWDKSTVGVTEDTKFVAKYERDLASVQVSVRGGNGTGKYTEGDIVTISFREIDGFAFEGWEVISGGVTVEENNGVYTFVVGAEDVVIQAVGTKDDSESGCGSTVSFGITAISLLCGAAFIATKRRKEN